MNNLPFYLIEENINDQWKPDLNQEYLIIYQHSLSKKFNVFIGIFHEVWYGYSFHGGYYPLQFTQRDRCNFKRIYRFIRLEIEQETIENEFLKQEDVEI